MLEITIGYYLTWLVITYLWSKTRNKNVKERKYRFFFGTFLIHTIFYIILYLTGVFEYLLSK